MRFVLALAPILLMLIMMVGLRWSAARAGAAGYLSGMLIGVAYFGATPELLAYAHVKALLFSVDVLMIIWAAFLLYRVADEAGAIRTIGKALPSLTPDRGLQALIIGWVFASFLQGVGGFGVPVAVTAPLLVGIGLDPLAAVVVPSIGHGWAVTFGSMGSSFQALMAATGISQAELGPPAALFLSLTCPVIGLMIAHYLEGWGGVGRLLPAALVWGIVMGGMQLLVVRAGAWNIGAFIAGMAGLLATPVIVRLYAGKKERTQEGGKIGSRSFLVAISGYAILILVTLLVEVVPAVKQLLSVVVIRIPFPEIQSAQGFITPAGTGRQINLFAHIGMVLFYSAILAYLGYRAFGQYQSGSIRRILNGTLDRVIPSSISIVSMISLAQVMELSGMTDTLARGLAEGVGALYPLFAPWIGALGAFVTGSNTNSNVVFGALQLHTANLLDYPATIILAAQTAGAALASITAPAKVVVGCSTVEMTGKEGEVLRRLAKYALFLVLLVSLMAYLGV
jgi:lactate permease